MKTVAIITEYNPFHRGHGLQLEKIRELYGEARIIAIMSGNTVQRGEVALFDKYLRAEAAIRCGVSAVFEIPFPYSCACAEIFAGAGVSISNSLGGIDALVFGSECGDIEALTKMSRNLQSEEFQKALCDFSKENRSMPYPKRRQTVYEGLYGKGSFSSGSNDILGIEYINALSQQGSGITAVTYKREAGYTAKAARSAVREGRGVLELGEICRHVFEGKPHTDSLRAGELMLQAVKREGYKKADEIFDMPTDLWAKMKDASMSARSFSDFTERMKGSGYTDARIRRGLMYLWCGVEKISDMPKYTTLLGADNRGREYLSAIRKNKEIEVLTKPADYNKMSKEAVSQFEKGVVADCLFAYALKEPLSYGDLVRKGPYIKR
ncbi:MAG: nucleotidyltransferase family protein [Ruminococcaceae bacterium]|nr:nucleotidyltransferase family protein [Oscillospiraceae bacterium]